MPDTRDLFTPARLGAVEIPNRVLMAPMTRSRAGRDGVPGKLAPLYYAQWASVGLIVTEATQVAKSRGAEVFGTASAPKHDAIRANGVDHPIDYRSTDFEGEVRISPYTSTGVVVEADTLNALLDLAQRAVHGVV